MRCCTRPLLAAHNAAATHCCRRRLSASTLLLLLQLVEAGDAASYAAGTREAALHAMAGRHPNVVPLLDAFEHRSPAGRHACLVLERCGSNLLYVSGTGGASAVVLVLWQW